MDEGVERAEQVCTLYLPQRCFSVRSSVGRSCGVVETMKVSSLNPNSKWANPLTTGSLSFLVCKMGTHPVPISQS